MEPFKGFPPGKTRTTRVPNRFFSELLPLIDDLDELRLTLYCFWAMQQQEGDYRYLTLDDVLRDELFVSSFGGLRAEAQPRIQAALDNAVARGTLLHIEVDGAGGAQDVYFMNTARGRNAVHAIRDGQFEPGSRDFPVSLVSERPNVYLLYEQNIGPLTPLISEQLRDAEQEFPTHWLEEAIQLAVERNARNWRYVMGILKRWQAEGKDRGIAQRPTQADRYRYIQGEYSDTIDY